ncbi:DUF5615 family PIN-like protein [Halosimplex marinum]|uniref:DUF5615 family PIN-like protein n=1 Tax=Halosimplex marinum TaxID=3396620 RepID=UPI003F56EE7A
MDHDVVRVVDCPELGPGTADGEIVAFAERDDRLLVTYDDDLLTQHETLNRIGVLFQENGRTPAFETANIVNEIWKHVDQRAVVEHGEAYHLTGDWV